MSALVAVAQWWIVCVGLGGCSPVVASMCPIVSIMTLSGVLHSKHLSHTVVCIVGSGCVWRVSHAMCMDREDTTTTVTLAAHARRGLNMLLLSQLLVIVKVKVRRVYKAAITGLN